MICCGKQTEEVGCALAAVEGRVQVQWRIGGPTLSFCGRWMKQRAKRERDQAQGDLGAGRSVEVALLGAVEVAGDSSGG
jgi:hypothetical protein